MNENNRKGLSTLNARMQNENKITATNKNRMKIAYTEIMKIEKEL